MVKWSVGVCVPCGRDEACSLLAWVRVFLVLVCQVWCTQVSLRSMNE